MKSNGSVAPDVVRVEPHPQKEGIMVIRLAENVAEIENGYSYDEYILEVPGYPMLKTDILANIDTWMAQARIEEEMKRPAEERLEEAKTEIARLKERNEMLEDCLLEMSELVYA